MRRTWEVTPSRPVRHDGRRTLISRTRCYGSHRLHSMSSDRYRLRRAGILHYVHSLCRPAIDRNHIRSHQPAATYRSGTNRSRYRPSRREIATRTVANVIAPAAKTPPGVAASAGHPTPAKVVVKIPQSALERRVAPVIPRVPDVAVARVTDPTTVPIGIPTRSTRLGIEGRPHISLTGHVVPISIRVQITHSDAGRIIACSGRLLRGRSVQHLIAVGVPAIPRIWLNRLGEVEAG